MIPTDTSKRSSNIAHTLYDPANQTLTITFKSGGSYQYTNVSPLDHDRFLNSPSLGKSFNQLFYAQAKLHPSQKISEK